MKRLAYIVALVVVALTFASCRGGKNMASYNLDLPSPNFPYQNNESGEWTVTPRWLYTENSFSAANYWETGINQDYYFFPERYVSKHMSDCGVVSMRGLFMEDFIDAVDSARHTMPTEQVVYMSEVRYEKADIDYVYTLDEPSDSLIDAVIGKLTVTMTIKSIGEKSCNIPVKLYEYHLAEITSDPIRDGLLLYMAQAPSYISTYWSVTELSNAYINSLLN